MKKGRTQSCPKKDGVIKAKNVRFMFVDAYCHVEDFGDAACNLEPQSIEIASTPHLAEVKWVEDGSFRFPILTTEEAALHRHSVSDEWDFINPFKAAYNAFCLRGQILFGAATRVPAAPMSSTYLKHDVNGSSSHVSDRWCSKSCEASLDDMSIQVENSKQTMRASNYEDPNRDEFIEVASPPFETFKPNPLIQQRFDDVIPYRHQTTDGYIYFGHSIPPIHWEEHRMFRSAASHGAVYRDDDGELRVTLDMDCYYIGCAGFDFP